jgi:hypothetical protein
MPLYTYVVTYNNSIYVGQGSHSNFRGFIKAWCNEMPDNALSGFNSGLKKELMKKAYHGPFDPVPNRKNVWKKVIELKGNQFVIHAIETKN